MKRLAYGGLMLLVTAALGLAAPQGTKSRTFTGTISDKMCGAKHMMEGKSAKECTLECGPPFVLVTADGKIYELSNKETPKEFAGQQVNVIGTLKGELITVKSIAAAKQ